MTKKILCVGNCVLDKVFEVENIPRPGQKVLAFSSRESGGGPAATAAVAIAHLGGEVSFCGIIGDDAPGRLLRQKLLDHGVDTQLLNSNPDIATPTPIVLVDRSGERCIVVQRRKVVDFAFSSDAILPFSLLLVDTRWAEGVEMALFGARRAGVATVLDADGGDAAVLQKLASLADHVIFSQQGLSDFVGDGEIIAQLRRAAESCRGIVAVTAGATGSFWMVDRTVTHIKAFPVKAADTTGCGDVFHGAYSLAIVEGMGPLAAGRFASAAAARKAASGLGWDGMPDRRSVEQLVGPR